MTAFIDQTAEIGNNVELGRQIIVSENVVIGDDVRISENVVICPGAIIGNGVTIGPGSIIGKPVKVAKTSTVKLDDRSQTPIKIGAGSVIGALCVLCSGSSFGEESFLADQCFVREEVSLGAGVLVGRNVTVENKTSIGAYTKIQTNAYITAMSTLEDNVFIAPCVITTNDNFMGRTKERFKVKGGPTIRRGARVGAGVLILPRIVIGIEAFVAAGSVVTRDVADYTLVMGSPARPVRSVPENEWVDNQEK